MAEADTALLARHFIEDRRALERLSFSTSSIHASDIRMLCAPLLRKWIVDGNFLRLQKQLGIRVAFPIEDFRNEIRACERGDLSVFAGVISSVEDKPFGPFSYAPPGRDPKLPVVFHGVVDLPIKDLGRQRILFWKSRFATRTDFIKYVCNKWGGIHFDMNLNDEIYAVIDEARYLFGLRRERDRLSLQVNFNGTLEIQGRAFPDDFVDIALLGILNTSQSFCRGTERYLPDIANLMK